jgi:hypothetical protein
MRVTTGRVEDGKIVVLEEPPLEEGTEVTIVVPEGDETFELNEEDEAELLAAIQQADRGEVVSGEEVLRKLRQKG